MHTSSRAINHYLTDVLNAIAYNEKKNLLFLLRESDRLIIVHNLKVISTVNWPRDESLPPSSHGLRNQDIIMEMIL